METKEKTQALKDLELILNQSNLECSEKERKQTDEAVKRIKDFINKKK